jgi:hypothetical protein
VTNRTAPATTLVFDLNACADLVSRPRFRSPLRSWQGDIGVSDFISQANRQGFSTATPFNAFLPFDVIVICSRKLSTVQVKRTNTQQAKGWHVALRPNNKPYREGDFDFLAATVPDGTWYIIPGRLCFGRAALLLPRLPSQKKNKFAKYAERWELFT